MNIGHNGERVMEKVSTNLLLFSSLYVVLVFEEVRAGISGLPAILYLLGSLVPVALPP